MLKTITFHTQNMYKSALGGYTNATDAADWLVKKGVPFRQAHEIIGALVLYALGRQKPLNELSLEELKKVSPVFDETLYEAISVEACVKARNLTGGPAGGAVLEALEKAESFLDGLKNKR
jgi:argininosuccinate lyase